MAYPTDDTECDGSEALLKAGKFVDPIIEKNKAIAKHLEEFEALKTKVAALEMTLDDRTNKLMDGINQLTDICSGLLVRIVVLEERMPKNE